MNGGVIIIGAGGHAAVLVDSLLAGGIELLGLTDVDPARCGTEVCGLRVLGDDSALSGFDPRVVRLVNGVGSVGDVTSRRVLQARLEAQGWMFTGVRHPAALVSRFANVAASAQILAGSVVQTRALLTQGCIINTGAVIEHDVSIGEFSHVAPGAVLCGDVRIAEHCHVGAGAVVRQGIAIGAGTVIAAGAVVVRDFAGGGVLCGVPARVREGAS